MHKPLVSAGTLFVALLAASLLLMTSPRTTTIAVGVALPETGTQVIQPGESQ